MAKSLAQVVRTSAYRWVMWQAIFTLILALLFLCIGGKVMAYSALLGGGICVLASAYFALRLFAYVGATKARYMVKALYRAELGKFALTLVMFFVAIKYMHVAALPFFLTYILVQMVL